MKKIVQFLFSATFMGLLFVISAFAMGIATFIESRSGTQAALIMVYDAIWFEVLLILLSVNLIGRCIIQKLYQKSKIAIFLFHLAFVIMILGAGITRYFGFEGSMSIREKEFGTECVSLNTYTFVEIQKNNEELLKDEKRFRLTPYANNSYNKSVSGVSVKFNKIIWNAIEQIKESPNGKPLVSILIINQHQQRKNVLLKDKTDNSIGNITIGLNSDTENDLNIILKGDKFYLKSKHNVSKHKMGAQNSEVIEAGSESELEKMLIYQLNGNRVIVSAMYPSAIMAPSTMGHMQHLTNRHALSFTITNNTQKEDIFVWSDHGDAIETALGDYRVKISFGPKKIKLPFKIYLDDFEMERYPGSNSPSSYKSYVTLIDENNDVKIPYEIYMNNILKYKGYRFYQSSFDKDEKGTILSVSKDTFGMGTTYFGYFLLFACIILALFSKKSLYRNVTPNLWDSKFVKLLILGLIFTTGSLKAETQALKVDKKDAEKFGTLLIQDNKGRTKPLFTYSNDILRKVSRKLSLNGHTPMQVLMGLTYDFENWQNEPLIRVSNSKLRGILGVKKGKHASFSQIVDLSKPNGYKLSPHLEGVHAKKSSERSKFDKELIKVDERVNIVYMIAQGEFLKMFPLKNSNGKNWGTPTEAIKYATERKDSLFVQNIMGLYYQYMKEDNKTKMYECVDAIKNYQRKFAGYELASDFKTKTEVIYYKVNIFERLLPYFAISGLFILILLIIDILSGRERFSAIKKIFTGLIAIGFVAQILGFAIRWYISGRAPLSNGYETMIFISVIMILIGFIYGRKNLFVLCATAIIAALTLLVAHLSFMDPEITNLVPVLKSYWLTLHVSVITASYAFFALGSVIGLIVMILTALSTLESYERVQKKIDELTVINFKTLTIGLYLLTIGTFLGAIWANESWGRYWGWDPKETWSLITIIVYSFVVHSHKIPGFQTKFAFNIMSLFALSSVLMTYFGVNYFLSGLHSYAGGEASSVPVYVYVIYISLITLCVVSYIRAIKLSK